MKALRLLIWLTQLGLSVALPPAGFIWLAVWLRKTYALGVWVLIVGIVLGFATAFDGLRTSLKAMELLSKEETDSDGFSDFHHS